MKLIYKELFCLSTTKSCRKKVSKQVAFCFTQDLCGSAIKYLVLNHFWPGSTQEKQLAYASEKLVKFAKDNKKPLQLKKFTKTNVGWNTGRCPELHCKGFDTYVVLSFLVSEISSKDCGF